MGDDYRSLGSFMVPSGRSSQSARDRHHSRTAQRNQAPRKAWEEKPNFPSTLNQKQKAYLEKRDLDPKRLEDCEKDTYDGEIRCDYNGNDSGLFDYVDGVNFWPSGRIVVKEEKGYLSKICDSITELFD